MQIFNVIDRHDFLDEIARLTLEEWGSYKNREEYGL